MRPLPTYNVYVVSDDKLINGTADEIILAISHLNWPGNLTVDQFKSACVKRLRRWNKMTLPDPIDSLTLLLVLESLGAIAIRNPFDIDGDDPETNNPPG